jgi:hypothetical protein
MARRLFPTAPCCLAAVMTLALAVGGSAQTVAPPSAESAHPDPIFSATAGPQPDGERIEEPPLHGGHPREDLFDNLSLFLGVDGSKQPQDLGINAHLGGRFGVNLGFPLLRDLGIGGQLGTALNYSNNAVHVLDQIGGSHDRWQSFTTVGLFQRTAWGFDWGVAYDFLAERYFDNFYLGLWRGQVGYALGACDEVGMWLTVGDRGDHGALLGTPIHLQPLTQANLFWCHTWASMAQTTVWMGMAERHGQTVFVFPRDSETKNVFVYGAQLHVPLNDRLAIFGAANFITPADTGTVDAYLGFAFYPGGGARHIQQQQFAPLFPVANNPTFAVDLRR